MLREIMEKLNEAGVKLNSTSIKKIMGDLGAELIGQTKKSKKTGYAPSSGRLALVYQLGKVIIVLTQSSSGEYTVSVYKEKLDDDIMSKFNALFNFDGYSEKVEKLEVYSSKFGNWDENKLIASIKKYK